MGEKNKSVDELMWKKKKKIDFSNISSTDSVLLYFAFNIIETEEDKSFKFSHALCPALKWFTLKTKSKLCI